MPRRTRKRKPKRRKPSSRKKARSRRPASRPRVNTPSDDEDFVPHGEGEESSSGYTEQEDDEQEEDSDQEEDTEDEGEPSGKEVRNFDANVGSSTHRYRRARNGIANATSHSSQPRRQRHKENRSDEDFNVVSERALDSTGFAGNRLAADGPSSRPRHKRHRENDLDEDFDKDAQRSLEDDGTGREVLPLTHASQSRRQHARRNSSNEDFDIDLERDFKDDRIREHANHASHPARVRRRHRRQDSLDEDFEVDMERILENSSIANEGARPVTRAMNSCQVSDLHVEGQGNMLSNSFEHEARGFIENSDALQNVTARGLGAGEPSLQIRDPQEAHASWGGRANSAGKSVQIDKRKGKEKVLEGEESTASLFASETLLSSTKAANPDEETSAVVCGICWTEMVEVERGKLDCCDHFFCFGCIMEWAKVESRCPMCKQRFTTIAKPGTGISKRTRTIRIPLRDQVYIPPEDQDFPLDDPYADIVCMECHGTGDEGLLLLCDSCDSAAHTFCVGLGRSVPRGDWYCRDCQALIGGTSGSEDEAEDLVSASDDDDDDEDNDDEQREDDDSESLLRSIVASVNPPASQRTRQTTVQRRSTSTSSSLPSARNARGRLWQRLSRRQRGRYRAAPRLSQAARASLSSLLSDLNQVPRASEAPQNGSARTVPQQRRLHERINEIRNNWGRIQNGDLQFDALRTRATAVSSNANAASISPTPSVRSAVSDKRDVDSVEQPESSTQGNKHLQQAWRMMGHAQNLSAGIGSSNLHQQKLGASPSSSVLGRVKQPTENTSSSATSNLPFAKKNMEIPTRSVPSPAFENGNAGIYKLGSTPSQVLSNLKHDESPLGQVSMPVAPSALTSVPGECRKEEFPCSSNSKQTLAAGTSPSGFDKDLCRPAGGKHTVNLLERVSNGQHKIASTHGFKPELAKSSRHFERKDAGTTLTVKENTRMKENQDISAAKENIGARSLSSPPHEGLKVHLTELVKKQTWPVYIAERLDKEQFKRIARGAVHSLLALCDPNNKSLSLSCVHFEDQGNDPVVKCCNNCLDQHVEKAVKNAKDKIILS